MKKIELKPYLKVITPKHIYGVCAIYEPHPFRNSAIKESIEQNGGVYDGHTGIDDMAWCWVYYDWCGNPIGLSDSFPEGDLVDKFTAENIGSQSLADYLNKENEEFIKAWNRRADNEQRETN